MVQMIAGAAALADSPELDPDFVGTGGDGLRLADTANDLDMIRYLAGSVARSPLTLERHLQRILWLRSSGLSHLLPGAIADLFLSLGPHGQALRSRMLLLVRDIIDSRFAEFFDQHLEAGMSPRDALPDLPGSVLAQGYDGQAEMVRRQHGRGAALDHLSEARARLNDGQADEACDLLESALLDNPHDAVVASDLLEIYVHARDVARARRLVERLRERGAEPPARLLGLLAEWRGPASGAH